MTKQSDSLLRQALELSSLEKAQIIEELLVSLDNPDTSLDAVWAKEADARVEAFNNGKVSARSDKEILGKYSRS